jgi:hypothetical protein
MLEQIAYCESCGLKRAARILRKQLAQYRDPNWAGNIKFGPDQIEFIKACGQNPVGAR